MNTVFSRPFPLFLLRLAACPALLAEVGFLAFQLDVIVPEELPPVILTAALDEVTRLETLFPAAVIACLATPFRLLFKSLEVSIGLPSAALVRAFTPITLRRRALLGVVAAHLAPLVSCSVERLHHLSGVSFGHLDIRELAQQIDVAHLLAAAYMLVDKLHYLAGIEAVGLSKVDEQPLVTRLRSSSARGRCLP